MCTAECTFGMFERRAGSGQRLFCVAECESDLFPEGDQQLCGCAGVRVSGSPGCYAECPEQFPYIVAAKNECVSACPEEYKFLDEAGAFCVERCGYAYVDVGGVRRCASACGALRGPGEGGECALRGRTVAGVVVVVITVIGLGAVVAVLCVKRCCERRQSSAGLLESGALATSDFYTGVQGQGVG